VRLGTMNAGDNTPTYGHSGDEAQDGQIRPIPVPGQGGASVPAERKGGRMAGLMAISSTLALIAFMIIGFVFDGWAWGWVVFLMPGLLKSWQAAQN